MMKIRHLMATMASTLLITQSFLFSQPRRRHMCLDLSPSNSKTAKLLQDPNPNSIGNFFENKTEETSFIQCYMLALGEVYGNQYGVGFPVDMPVSLTYFEGNELKPVKEDYPDYDHLVNHVSVQLENNDLQIYKTPVVLTLQGEFDDEQMNQIYTSTSPNQKRGSRDVGNRLEDDNEEDEEDDGELPEEVTIADVIAMEGLDNDDDDYDDNDEYDDDEENDENEEDDVDSPGDLENEDDNTNMSSFLNSSPSGKNDMLDSIPDISIYRPENPDLSDIPQDAIVTDEDAKSLRKAHRKADRIIQYAADVKLIGSFHYKKKNFHLVKLLEPMFLVGRRIMDIKGFYFTLLNDEESAKITPVLENLLVNRPKTIGNGDYVSPAWKSSKTETSSSKQKSSDENSSMSPKSADYSTRRSSRRKWRDRQSGKETTD